jgi:hypothetical protein
MRQNCLIGQTACLVALALALVLVLATVMGCSGSEKAYLDLTWEDFDQSPTSGWRPLAERGDFAEAARMIEEYLEHHDDLQPAQLGYSRFHAGQLWAMQGDTESALGFIDRATVADMPPEFPQSFNSLVLGTRSFLRDDMATVRTARDEVAAMPDLTSRDREFLEALDLLANSEGLTYQELYALAIESRR